MNFFDLFSILLISIVTAAIVVLISNVIRDVSVEFIIECAYCKRQFWSYKRYVAHMKKHHIEEMKGENKKC